jgi:23S rRNA pseudouridine2605 synthase
VINSFEKRLASDVPISPVFGAYYSEKEYRVLVARHPDEEQLATWRRGVIHEDGYRTAPANVRLESYKGKGTWLRVLMHEGHKRQIREIGSRLGLPVVKIIRTRISSLQLGSLEHRRWRNLNPKEVAAFKGKVVSFQGGYQWKK